jgi:hypothetical protein
MVTALFDTLLLDFTTFVAIHSLLRNGPFYYIPWQRLRAPGNLSDFAGWHIMSKALYRPIAARFRLNDNQLAAILRIHV